MPEDNQVFVLLGGLGYFVGVNDRKLVSKTECDYIESAIYNEPNKTIVASEGCSILLLKGTKQIWRSKRISADGISFTSQQGDIIHGKLNDLTSEGCEFNFNINTTEIISSWMYWREMS